MIGLIPLIIAGAYVGWNIGANDAGNCIGTTVGSGLLSYRRAILLVAGFAILGGLLQGGNVMHTIGKGIVTSDLPPLAILVALISGGLFVTLATVFKLPVSTSEAIVGGMLGIGLAAGADINFVTLGKIVQVCGSSVRSSWRSSRSSSISRSAPSCADWRSIRSGRRRRGSC